MTVLQSGRVAGGGCELRQIASSERRGNNLKGFKDFYLEAKARI